MDAELLMDTSSVSEQDFFNSSLCREIFELLPTSDNPLARHIGMDWRVAASGTPTPTGHILVLSIRDNEAPGSNLVEVTDEKLLEKLRSIKGQYSYQRNPVYYYEDAPVQY